VLICEQPLYSEHAVSIDNRAGGLLATQHLLGQGYRHIGTITGPLGWAVAQQRLLGWQDALPSHQSHHMFEGDWSAASGECGLYQLRQQYPEMDAVFAGNDQMALGVLQAALQMGLQVPQDLAVIGFDNIPEASYFHPPLSTIRHKLADQGKIAVQQLVEMIEARRNKNILSPEAVILQPELIIRKSSIRTVG
jgi:DNA-binding LacI/PurR family transcriptional regulator